MQKHRYLHGIHKSLRKIYKTLHKADENPCMPIKTWSATLQPSSHTVHWMHGVPMLCTSAVPAHAAASAHGAGRRYHGCMACCAELSHHDGASWLISLFFPTGFWLMFGLCVKHLALLRLRKGCYVNFCHLALMSHLVSITRVELWGSNCEKNIESWNRVESHTCFLSFPVLSHGCCMYLGINRKPCKKQVKTFPKTFLQLRAMTITCKKWDRHGWFRLILIERRFGQMSQFPTQLAVRVPRNFSNPSLCLAAPRIRC